MEISEVKNENTLTVKTTVLDKEQRSELAKVFEEKYGIDVADYDVSTWLDKAKNYASETTNDIN